MASEESWTTEQAFDWFFSLSEEEQIRVLLEFDSRQSNPASPFNRPQNPSQEQ